MSDIEIPLDSNGLELSDAEREVILGRARIEGAERVMVRADGVDRDGCPMLGITYVVPPIRFNRIRRVTGYLADDVTSFNDAKRAEERDRVKHSLGGL